MTAILWIVMAGAFVASILAGNGTIPSYAYFPTAPLAAAVALSIMAYLLYTGRRQVRRMRAAERAALDDEPEKLKPAAPATPATPPAKVTARQAEVANHQAVLAQAASEAVPGTVRVDGHDGHYLEIDIKRAADPQGPVTIQVTAHNYSGNRFSAAVSSKLVRVRQVNWLKPVNLGNGENDRRRQMTGTTSPAELTAVMVAIAAIK